jgi:hypothetical protein
MRRVPCCRGKRMGSPLKWETRNRQARSDPVRAPGARTVKEALLRSITKRDREILQGKRLVSNAETKRLIGLMLIDEHRRPTRLARSIVEDTPSQLRRTARGHWPKGKKRSDISDGELAQAMRLLDAALATGLSVRQIGKITGIQPKTVWKWAARKAVPTPQSAQRLQPLGKLT